MQVLRYGVPLLRPLKSNFVWSEVCCNTVTHTYPPKGDMMGYCLAHTGSNWMLTNANDMHASQVQWSTIHRSNIHYGNCLPQADKPYYLVPSDIDTEQVFHKNLKIYEDFISEQEEQLLMDEIGPILKRLRYESDHWDNAIQGYRETERKQWSEGATVIINRIQDLAFHPGTNKLSYIHILDLQKSGCIKPHIDSVRFCGDTITGLSLLSSSIMRFVHENQKEKWVDVLLKRRSIYIMTGAVRYEYTHEVLDEDLSIFKGEVIPRDRRISIVCRNEPGT